MFRATKADGYFEDIYVVESERGDWKDAARRAADCTGETIIAWREAERHGIHMGIPYGS